MISTDKIERVHIKWEIGELPILMIMLSANGGVNRMGNGDSENKDLQLYMGTTEEPLFVEFMRHIPSDMFDYTGRYTMPNPKGEVGRLEIAFEGRDIDTGFECLYGTESDGPPEEMVSLVELALALTDPWVERKNSLKN